MKILPTQIAGLQIQNEREKQHTIEKHHEYIACMERKYDEDKVDILSYLGAFIFHEIIQRNRADCWSVGVSTYILI